MAFFAQNTTLSNSDAVIVAAASGRRLNIISIQITNTSASTQTVDLKDGTTIFQSLTIGGYGGDWQNFCNKGELGRLLTAGNALKAATRAAATGIEIVVEYGRV